MMSTRTVDHRAAAPRPFRRALVTGATSGIGWELALQLSGSGVPVVAIGRDARKLEALARRDASIEVLAFDLARTGALEELAARLVARYPDLDCVVNNAGIQNDVRMDDGDYGGAAIREEIDINLVAPLVLTRALLPHLLGRQDASVVNITSVLGYVPKPTAAVYSATKAGLHLFTQALRVQTRGTRLAVVEVVMPLVDTPMTAGRGHGHGHGKMPPAQAARALIEGLARGRTHIHIGKARAVPWLLRWAPCLLSRALQSSR